MVWKRLKMAFSILFWGLTLKVKPTKRSYKESLIIPEDRADYLVSCIGKYLRKRYIEDDGSPVLFTEILEENSKHAKSIEELVFIGITIAETIRHFNEALSPEVEDPTDFADPD